jgi:hypothetical protein
MPLRMFTSNWNLYFQRDASGRASGTYGRQCKADIGQGFQTLRGEIVTLQQRVDGAWRDVGRATLSSTGSYRFVLEPTRRGTYTYRVHRPAGANHAAGTSPTRTLTVS